MHPWCLLREGDRSPGVPVGLRQPGAKVSQATKDAVYPAYGMTNHFNGGNGEVDHLISLELGGSNIQANLFPEVATPVPGSHQKDKLENRLHDEVCSGQITLRMAQREIAINWVAVYRHEFGL